jgi:hypothetical protein
MIPAGYLPGIKGKQVKNTGEYFEKRNAHGEMPLAFYTLQGILWRH